MKQSCVIRQNKVVKIHEKKKSFQFDFVKIGKGKTVTCPKESRIQGLRDKKELEKLNKYKKEASHVLDHWIQQRAVRKDIRELTFIEELTYAILLYKTLKYLNFEG